MMKVEEEVRLLSKGAEIVKWTQPATSMVRVHTPITLFGQGPLVTQYKCKQTFL